MDSRSGSRSVDPSSPWQKSGRNPEVDAYGTSWFPMLASVLLLLLAVVSPWAFGGVDSTRFLWPFVALAAICWLISLGFPSSPSPALPWAALPLAALVLWIVAQMFSIPPTLLKFLSPRAHEYWMEAYTLEHVGDALLAAARPAPIGLTPENAALQLSWLLLGVSVFVMSAQFLRSRLSFKAFFVLLALVGAGLAVFGVVQATRWDGKLFGAFDIGVRVKPFGPFINRNHGAAFLNLCLPGAACFFGWLAARERSRTAAELWSGQASGWTASLQNLGPGVVLALACTAFILFGLAASLSRGGVASFFVGAGAAFLAQFFQRNAIGSKRSYTGLIAAALLLTAGVGLVYLTGFNEKAITRFISVADEADGGRAARSKHWNNMVPAVRDFWAVGSGLGSYSEIHRPYTANNGDIIHEHADNTYLEILVELGVFGVACIAAFLLLGGRAVFVLLRRDRDPLGRLFALSAVFVLTSQAVHAFVDFPLYSPANLVVFAMWMGAACGRACRLAGAGVESSSLAFVGLPLGRWRGVGAVPAALVFLATVWAYREAYVQESIHWTIREHIRNPANEKTTLVTANRWVENLDALAALHPKSAQLRARLAECWIDRCRVQAREGVVAKQPGIDPSIAWQSTSIERLYAQVCSAARLKRHDELEGIRRSPPVEQNLSHAKQELAAACLLNPISAAPRLRLAELGFMFPSSLIRDRLVDSAARLAPGDADVQFRVGLLGFYADRRDEVVVAWKRSLLVSPRWLGPIYFHSVNWLGLTGMIEKIFPPDPRLLVELAEKQFDDAKSIKQRRIVLEHARSIFQNAPLPPATRFELAGRICIGLDDKKGAVENYQRATALDGRNALLRYRLSIALEQIGRLPEALMEAEAAAALAPQQPNYLSRVSVLRHSAARTPAPTP